MKTRWRKFLASLLALAMVVSLVSTMAFAASPSDRVDVTGQGTQASPYIVTTWDGIKACLNASQNDLGGTEVYVRLGSDINAQDVSEINVDREGKTKVYSLDLYGYTINIKCRDNQLFTVKDFASLYVNDSKTGGTINDTTGKNQIFYIKNRGHLFIYDGIYKTTSKRVSYGEELCTLQIYDGTFVSEETVIYHKDVSSYGNYISVLGGTYISNTLSQNTPVFYSANKIHVTPGAYTPRYDSITFIRNKGLGRLIESGDIISLTQSETLNLYLNKQPRSALGGSYITGSRLELEKVVPPKKVETVNFTMDETRWRVGNGLDELTFYSTSDGVSGVTAYYWEQDEELVNKTSTIAIHCDYTAMVHLAAASGYLFTEDTVFYFRGSEVKVNLNETGKSATVWVNVGQADCDHYYGDYTNEAGSFVDSVYHWQVCEICGLSNAKQKHNFVMSEKPYFNQWIYTCIDCGYVYKVDVEPEDLPEEEQVLPTTIYKVALNEDLFAEGEAIPTAPAYFTPVDKAYNVTAVSWEREDGNPVGTTFEQGVSYSLTLTVEPNDGYIFNKGTYSFAQLETVNDWKYTIMQSSLNEYVYKLTGTAKKKPYVSIQMPTQLAGLTYLEGIAAIDFGTLPGGNGTLIHYVQILDENDENVYAALKNQGTWKPNGEQTEGVFEAGKTYRFDLYYTWTGTTRYGWKEEDVTVENAMVYSKLVVPTGFYLQTYYLVESGPEFTIQFDAQGGKAVAPSETTYGQLVSIPTTKKPDNIFLGWYTAAEGGERIDEEYIFTENTLVYAQWLPATGDDTRFTDVPKTQWYYDAVNWAVDRHITAGMGEGTFQPDGICTRAQAVTFLWNAAGKPEAIEITTSPFTDVQPGDWYYNAVLWAVEENITAGMGDGTFGANLNCTRAAIVTFLWNAAGKPEPTTTTSPFSDVQPGDWYYNAVLWAVERGITAGMGDGIFGSNNHCTRAQIVQFLYNDWKNEIPL